MRDPLNNNIMAWLSGLTKMCWAARLEKEAVSTVLTISTPTFFPSGPINVWGMLWGESCCLNNSYYDMSSLAHFGRKPWPRFEQFQRRHFVSGLTQMWGALGEKAVVSNEVSGAEVDLLQGLLHEGPNLRLHLWLRRLRRPVGSLHRVRETGHLVQVPVSRRYRYSFSDMFSLFPIADVNIPCHQVGMTCLSTLCEVLICAHCARRLCFQPFYRSQE